MYGRILVCVLFLLFYRLSVSIEELDVSVVDLRRMLQVAVTPPPTFSPSYLPTFEPSIQPTYIPTFNPTIVSTGQPTIPPTFAPTATPTVVPSAQPTYEPSRFPTSQPTRQPTGQPSQQPSSQPTIQPSRQPTSQPSKQPTIQPSSQPSLQPSLQPSFQPTNQPTSFPSCPSTPPTGKPSIQPSSQPSSQPTIQPMKSPTSQPTRQPSFCPTSQPSTCPTTNPSVQPTCEPTSQPSSQPTMQPTSRPTTQPSNQPSMIPTSQPSRQPSSQPTLIPSSQPSVQPSQQPTAFPSSQPTTSPTQQPSVFPSSEPSRQPSLQPSSIPSMQPTCVPSIQPSQQPTNFPSNQPSTLPSKQPFALPSCQPSCQPSVQPSNEPSCQPSTAPSVHPSSIPSDIPSSQPSSYPSKTPSSQPSSFPSQHPSCQPSIQPLNQPSSEPTSQPSFYPTSTPSSQPTDQPSHSPTAQPTVHPTSQPSNQPTIQPSKIPTIQPSSQPSFGPTAQPSNFPSAQPCSFPTRQPSQQPAASPTTFPSLQPSVQPSYQPSTQPTLQPSTQPSKRPSSQPSRCPTNEPTSLPTSAPTSFELDISRLGAVNSKQLHSVVSIIGVSFVSRSSSPFSADFVIKLSVDTMEPYGPASFDCHNIFQILWYYAPTLSVQSAIAPINISQPTTYYFCRWNSPSSVRISFNAVAYSNLRAATLNLTLKGGSLLQTNIELSTNETISIKPFNEFRESPSLLLVFDVVAASRLDQLLLCVKSDLHLWDWSSFNLNILYFITKENISHVLQLSYSDVTHFGLGLFQISGLLQANKNEKINFQLKLCDIRQLCRQSNVTFMLPQLYNSNYTKVVAQTMAIHPLQLCSSFDNGEVTLVGEAYAVLFKGMLLRDFNLQYKWFLNIVSTDGTSLLQELSSLNNSLLGRIKTFNWTQGTMYRIFLKVTDLVSGNVGYSHPLTISCPDYRSRESSAIPDIIPSQRVISIGYGEKMSLSVASDTWRFFQWYCYSLGLVDTAEYEWRPSCPILNVHNLSFSNKLETNQMATIDTSGANTRSNSSMIIEIRRGTNREELFVTKRILIVNSIIPTINILTPNSKLNRVMPDQSVNIAGIVTAPIGRIFSTARWTLLNVPYSSNNELSSTQAAQNVRSISKLLTQSNVSIFVPQNESTVQRSTTTYMMVLKLPSNLLLFGAHYVFRLSCGGNVADVEVTTNRPPYGGNFVSSPTNGIAMKTTFSFVASKWRDDNIEDFPLHYTFSFWCDTLEASGVLSTKWRPIPHIDLLSALTSVVFPRINSSSVLHISCAVGDSLFAITESSLQLIMESKYPNNTSAHFYEQLQVEWYHMHNLSHQTFLAPVSTQRHISSVISYMMSYILCEDIMAFDPIRKKELDIVSLMSEIIEKRPFGSDAFMAKINAILQSELLLLYQFYSTKKLQYEFMSKVATFDLFDSGNSQSNLVYSNTSSQTAIFEDFQDILTQLSSNILEGNFPENSTLQIPIISEFIRILFVVSNPGSSSSNMSNTVQQLPNSTTVVKMLWSQLGAASGIRGTQLLSLVEYSKSLWPANQELSSSSLILSSDLLSVKVKSASNTSTEFLPTFSADFDVEPLPLTAIDPPIFRYNCSIGIKEKASFLCPESFRWINISCSGKADVQFQRQCPVAQRVCSVLRLSSGTVVESGSLENTNEAFCQASQVLGSSVTCKCGFDDPNIYNNQTRIDSIVENEGVSVAVMTQYTTATTELSGAISISEKQVLTSSFAQSSSLIFITVGTLWSCSLLLIGYYIYGSNYFGFKMKAEKRSLGGEHQSTLDHQSDLMENGVILSKAEIIKKKLREYLESIVPTIYHTGSIRDVVWNQFKQKSIYLRIIVSVFSSSTASNDANLNVPENQTRTSRHRIQISGNEQEIKSRRILDVVHVVTSISLSFFLIALLYDLQYSSDDGSCEAFTEESTCLARKTLLDPSQTYCVWQSTSRSSSMMLGDDDTASGGYIIEGLPSDAQKTSLLEAISGSSASDIYTVQYPCSYNISSSSLTANIVAVVLVTLFSAPIAFFLEWLLRILRSRRKNEMTQRMQAKQFILQNQAMSTHSELMGSYDPPASIVSNENNHRTKVPRNDRRRNIILPEVPNKDIAFAPVIPNVSTEELSPHYNDSVNNHVTRQSAVVQDLSRFFTRVSNLSRKDHINHDVRVPFLPKTIKILRRYCLDHIDPSPRLIQERTSFINHWCVHELLAVQNKVVISKDMKIISGKQTIVHDLQLYCTDAEYAYLLLQEWLIWVLSCDTSVLDPSRSGALHVAHSQKVIRSYLAEMWVKDSIASAAHEHVVSETSQWIAALVLILVNVSAVFYVAVQGTRRGYLWQRSFLVVCFWEWLSEVTVVEMLDILFVDILLPSVIRNYVLQRLDHIMNIVIQHNHSLSYSDSYAAEHFHQKEISKTDNGDSKVEHMNPRISVDAYPIQVLLMIKSRPDILESHLITSFFTFGLHHNQDEKTLDESRNYMPTVSLSRFYSSLLMIPIDFLRILVFFVASILVATFIYVFFICERWSVLTIGSVWLAPLYFVLLLLVIIGSVSQLVNYALATPANVGHHYSSNMEDRSNIPSTSKPVLSQSFFNGESDDESGNGSYSSNSPSFLSFESSSYSPEEVSLFSVKSYSSSRTTEQTKKSSFSSASSASSRSSHSGSSHTSTSATSSSDDSNVVSEESFTYLEEDSS